MGSTLTQIFNSPLKTPSLLPGILGVVFICLVAVTWVGFLGSDDATYAIGAYGWLENFPYVGGHGTIRYTITIPIALSFTLFGENEYSLVLPTLIYSQIFVVSTFYFLSSKISSERSFFALLFVITNPLFVVQSSVASVDPVELAFLFLSFFLYLDCVSNGVSNHKMFASGIFAGLAFLTRETAIFIAPFFGILFLLRYRMGRWSYWMIAGGFLSVWLVEALYLYIMTGDPLFRFNISMNHDSSINRNVDVAGNLIVHPLVDPFFVVLFNQEFAFLYWMGIPLGIWLCFSSTIDGNVQRLGRLLGLLATVWFICVGAAFSLLPLNPRYFMVTTGALCLMAGIALYQLWAVKGMRRVSAALSVLLIGGNFAGLAVENPHHMFGERTLVRVADRTMSEIVYTDPMTRHRAEMLLRWKGTTSRVSSQPPPRGGLYLHNGLRTARPNRLMPKATIPGYLPKPEWRAQRRFDPSVPIIARILEGIGLSGVLPSFIWRKLRYRHPGVTLYRVPQN